jgi:hypothetical protein
MEMIMKPKTTSHEALQGRDGRWPGASKVVESSPQHVVKVCYLDRPFLVDKWVQIGSFLTEE